MRDFLIATVVFFGIIFFISCCWVAYLSGYAKAAEKQIKGVECEHLKWVQKAIKEYERSGVIHILKPERL